MTESRTRSSTSVELKLESLGALSYRREFSMMAGASAFAIGIFCLLAISFNVPLRELDRWMLILSVPWFVGLYAVCRSSIRVVIKVTARMRDMPIAIIWRLLEILAAFLSSAIALLQHIKWP